MDRSACFSEGGEWIKGLTPLSSHCASAKANTLPPHPPSQTDILDQKNREPPKTPETDLKQIIDIARFRSHVLGIPDGIMIGLGPKDAKVTWPLCAGDVVWRANDESHIDKIRRLGVYLGQGVIVDLGTAQRDVSKTTGHVYWRALIANPEERATITSPEAFTKGERLRCGVYNSSNELTNPRMEVVLMGAACVGTLLRRLTRPDAQHIAAYLHTGVWLIENISYRMATPVYFRGEFNKRDIATNADKLEFTKSQCTISASGEGEEGGIPDAAPDSYIVISCPSFSESYNTIQLAEELYRQKRDVQPYHDPLTGVFIAEDQVADVMMSAVALKSEKMAMEETI